MNDKNQINFWKRMSFKGNKVFAAADAGSNLLIKKDRVVIKYNLKQDYEYQVKPESLKAEDHAVPAQKKADGSKRQPKIQSIKAGLPKNCIKIYTDGASSGNPGPAGIGVLFKHGKYKKEISRYIGETTNNIAELTAIKTALEELKRVDLPVCIFSDSSYSIGALTENWKLKKNKELILTIQGLMAKFNDLTFIKVKGHAGIKENEVADFLATSAIKKKQR